ncbi:MAG: hypothetical protein V3T72_06440 [Thermoanaerobaculia bacterium]
MVTVPVGTQRSSGRTPRSERRRRRGTGGSSFAPGRAFYLALLDRALARPRATLAVTALLLAAGFAVLPALPRELVPTGRSRELNLELQWPAGTGRESAAAGLAALERAIGRSPAAARPLDVVAVYRGLGERRPGPAPGRCRC